MLKIADMEESPSAEKTRGILTFAALFWAVAAGIACTATLTLYLGPEIALEFYPFREPSGRLFALRLIERLRPGGWIVIAVSTMLAYYFFNARSRTFRDPVTQAGNDQNTASEAIYEHAAVWNWVLAVLIILTIVLWLWPINDGLQDDEGDKLKLALGSWQDWGSNFFNTRMNILPITLARLTFLVTGWRQEWLLRLPIFVIFAIPLVYMWTRTIKDRYGPVASALLLIFYGLHYVLGEYASKVQGYLPVLTFTTAQFLLWSKMIRTANSRPLLRDGILYVLVCIGGFLSHNYSILFVAAQFCASMIIDVSQRWRNKAAISVATTTAYAGLAVAILSVCTILGMKSIVGVVGFEGASMAELLSQLFIILTGGRIGLWSTAFLFVMIVSVIWAIKSGRAVPEACLAIVTLGILVTFYIVFLPSFFLARYMIWLPLAWLTITGIGMHEVVSLMRLTTSRVRWVPYAGACGFVFVTLLPSQVGWQEQRKVDPNLRVAADAIHKIASQYHDAGRSVGYLLLRSHANYSHRMWFYFPANDTVSDFGMSCRDLCVLQKAVGRDIWIIPVARGELDDDYKWISGIAHIGAIAGNMVIYVVDNEAIHNAATATIEKRT
jgi:hypothetical protein